MSLNPSYNIGMLCTKLCWTLSIAWAIFSIHFGTLLLVLELLDVVILTERIQILYIIHLLLILMTVIISGFTVSRVRLISES
jgi:hypothetical protein